MLEVKVEDVSCIYRAGSKLLFLRILQGSAVITMETQNGEEKCINEAAYKSFFITYVILWVIRSRKEKVFSCADPSHEEKVNSCPDLSHKEKVNSCPDLSHEEKVTSCPDLSHEERV